MENLQLANHPVEPPILTNTTTKAELLSRAKAAIDGHEHLLHDARASLEEAAELVALAQKEYCALQKEIAQAVGKSEAWVSRLLQWHREGCPGDSPFGPSTKEGRLKHAKDRVVSGASKPRKPRQPKATAAADNSAAAADNTDAETSTSNDAKASAHALAEFKYAVDTYIPKMDDAARQKATDYLLEKTGAAVS